MGNLYSDSGSLTHSAGETAHAISLHKNYLKEIKDTLVQYEFNLINAVSKEFCTKYPALQSDFQKNYDEIVLGHKTVTLEIHRGDINSTVPYKATRGSAGFDLAAVEDMIIYPTEIKKIRTGISIKFPPNSDIFGLIQPRSSVGKKGLSLLANVVDPDYTSEIYVVLTNISCRAVHISKGHRIAQILFLRHKKEMCFLECDRQFSNEDHAGFGSTGK